jgi:cell division protein FtsW
MLLAVVAVLIVVGLVMVLSASSVQSQREVGSTWSYFGRQVLWVGAGIGALVVTARLDYRRWQRLATPFLGVCMALLVLVLVPGLGVEINGARSWFSLGPVRMQPSELTKLALLLHCAQLLSRRANRVHQAQLTLVPVCVVAGAVAVLVMLQPDLGGTIVLASIAFAVLFVAGVPLLRLGAVGALAGGAAVALALAAPYRRNRILAFLDPDRDPLGIAFQLNQSFMGVASGGWTGLGLGESRAKWGFLPNAHTDFIFAIIAEELGLLGATVVVGLFLAFAVFGTRAALAAPDRFGALVAAGITAWILTQAFVNVGGVVGILPITGLTLPFISFGGTSLVITMAATGILLNVARQGRAPRPAGRTAPATSGVPAGRGR